MAQHDYVIDNQTSASLRTDLNNALAAIVSQNSGATAPATTYANQFWYDTANHLLKQRNESNTVWISLGTVDQTNNKFEPNQTFATQAEAEAGSNNTKAMTALRTAQAIAAGGGYDYQPFTASGTWTKPASAPSTAMVTVQMWGAGGSGGRNNGGESGGGGGGAYFEFTVPVSTLGATEAVTVGAGGANRTSNGNGTAGGNSIFAGKTVFGGGGGGNGSSACDGGGGGGLLGAGSVSSGGLFGGGTGADSGSNVAATLPTQTGGGGAGGAFSQSSSRGIYGGGGGGGGGTSSTSGSTSVFGGAGGNGATGSNNAVAGTSPAGGGGGSNSGTTGAGGNGEVRVYTIW